jgi:ion channel
VGLLRGLGYANVSHYRGGLADWTAGGGRLEQGTTPLLQIEVPAHRLTTPAPRRGPRGWASTLLDTIERQSTGRLFAAWLTMIFVCAVLYWAVGLSSGHGLLAGGHPVDMSLRGLGTAIYFSFVTATSVGYGDVVPLGAVRVLAVAEAVAGLLIFGAVVAKFVSRRQEELVREIHRVTFEERLSRVQSNLHLVLSELQAVAAMSEDGTIRPARVSTRLESATLVFAGELRAIHDLLYRPQWAPEEAVLGGILASLAASLRELTELLARLPSGFGRSEALDGTLQALARLAEEICGECVPRAYAPGLRVWMDRIQETARRIA